MSEPLRKKFEFDVSGAPEVILLEDRIFEGVNEAGDSAHDFGRPSSEELTTEEPLTKPEPAGNSGTTMDTAIASDSDNMCTDGGHVEPALKFVPFLDEDTAEIKELLDEAVATVVLRERSALAEGDALRESMLPAVDMMANESTNRDQLCDVNREAMCTYDEEDGDDFGEFSCPPQLPTELANGPETSVLQVEDGHMDENDDFGNFDQASFSEEASGGFANFEDASAAFLPSPDAVRPPTVTAFGETISHVFTAERSVQVAAGGSEINENSMADLDYGEFTASVQRDIAYCENVDEWPCVVFRYENSITRKGLLNALCINEASLNFPIFAIDCLSKAFLQPVKQRGVPAAGECHHGRRAEPNPAAGGDAAGQQVDLSDAAKDVLNKIPDLSFMKAEVLTFPTVSQMPLGVDL